jgi:hypothetical protein
VLVRLERTMEGASRSLATTGTAPRADVDPRRTTGFERN